MLSRGTSSASQRPRRARSTPSFRPQSTLPKAPSFNDAETTYLHAVTAANLAFERANERQRAKIVPNGQNATSIANNDGGPRLGRRQSVRFAGTTSIPLRNGSITRREVPGYKPSQHPYESQLQSQPYTFEPSITSHEIALTALTRPMGEFGESDNASVPSSYRRLRKAKSMFSPRKAPSAVFSDGIPNSRRHFHRQSLQSSETYHEPLRVPDPRLRKSYSFLRGVTDRISTNSRQYATNDAAVQLARDQYVRQLEQQRLKEQSSLLGLGNRRKTPKAFRRTVRTSSTNSYGSAIASPSAPEDSPKIKEIGHRARSLSQTIKKKIKRVFKRSSDADDTIPVQQIKATHPHYGEYIMTTDGKEQRYPPVPEPDAELLLRVGSRESVTYAAPTYVDKNARPASIRSAHSSDDGTNGNSRVTSWTDSTPANTINMPQTLERKRLSIIKEDGGPHQPSSSAHQFEGMSDRYASFRQPLRQSSAGRVGGSFDTRRMVSALQKKMDENNGETTLDDSESGTDSCSGQNKARPSTQTPTRASSLRKGGISKLSLPTHSRGANVSNTKSFGPLAMRFLNDDFYQHENQDSDREFHQQDFSSKLRKDMTPQQTAETNEHGIQSPKRPLREVKSAFFPPSTRIERSNPSPYRRAMHASSENESDSQSRTNFGDHLRSEGPSSAVTGQLRKGSVTGSDSIYSRSSGGHTPKATKSLMSLATSESSGEAGTAVIITGKNEQSSQPFTVHNGYSSVALSGNWRDFVATQVASLGDYGTPQRQTDDAQLVKGSGHRRENAQLDNDEVNIGRLRSPIEVLNQPLAIIQGNSQPQKATKHKASHSLGERSPLMSIGPVNNAVNVKQNESALLRRASEHSSNNSNVENERRSLSRVYGPSNGVWQHNSRSSLKLQTNQKNSPTTSSTRYSPGRAERLRRLKSSTGTSPGKPMSRNENQALYTPSSEKDYDSDSPDMNADTSQAQAGINRKLVDSFLKGRRSVMRISEESGTDPVFL